MWIYMHNRYFYLYILLKNTYFLSFKTQTHNMIILKTIELIKKNKNSWLTSKSLWLYGHFLKHFNTFKSAPSQVIIYSFLL